MSEIFEKTIKIMPASDRRHPEPDKNYGISGVRIFFILKGLLGVITFEMLTELFLPYVLDEFKTKDNVHSMGFVGTVHSHSLKPLYKDQKISIDKCEFLDNKLCYGNICSTDIGSQLARSLVHVGEDSVWYRLTELYQELLENNILE